MSKQSEAIQKKPEDQKTPAPKFFEKKKNRLLIGGAALLLALCIAGGCYAYWYEQQPKFHDLTVELGQTDLTALDFCTEFANPDRAELDLGQLDLFKAGSYPVTLRQGDREETVTLTVQDTVAPVAQFQDLTVRAGETPEAADFVVSSYDLAGTQASFVQPLGEPDYGGDTVEVAVTDPSGNQVTGTCAISYIWMKEKVALELGDVLTKADVLIDPKDRGLVNQNDINAVNAALVGKYTISSTVSGKMQTCTVVVVDTQGPELTLQPVVVFKGKKAALEDFIVSATDPSGEVETELLTELDFNTPGTQKVRIAATDAYGNRSEVETTLEVTQDRTPPVFAGLSAMSVRKNSSPDYSTGVRAVDGIDGSVAFTFDASKVDTSKAGTYYVTYRAQDKAGNVGTARRKVMVDHDDADTAALLADMASKAGNDPVSVKIYVRDHIHYNHNDGGDDPLWYGLTTKYGNCYVHARILQEVLKLKGYTTQLIWVTNRSHYWLIIDMGGYWRHIDATPGRAGPTGLMTDKERLETLSGRDWDHTAWPACE